MALYNWNKGGNMDVQVRLRADTDLTSVGEEQTVVASGREELSGRLATGLRQRYAMETYQAYALCVV